MSFATTKALIDKYEKVILALKEQTDKLQAENEKLKIDLEKIKQLTVAPCAISEQTLKELEGE